MVQGSQTFNAMENSSIELPDSSAFADMEMSRDGQDLILQSDNGQDIVIENYFTAEPQPVLEASDGSVLTPELVSAFVQSPEQLAQIETAAGTEPVGAIEELHGDATVTRADGSSEPVTLGTEIYQGDVVETSADGGVNILFIDETSMALSEGARFAVTDYSFDAQTESGTTNFSVLRGVFVFTSGLIGRDDPDDVTIDTPVGSIGIRGTIIAGHINPDGESSISVVEGAIVVKNGAGERTLSEQFETIQVDGFNSEMQDMGVLEPAAVMQTYGSASYVIPSLFSNINDTAKEQAAEEEQQQAEEALDAVEEVKEEVVEEPVEEILEQKEILMEQPLEIQEMQKENQKNLDQKEQQHKQQQQEKNEELRETELQNPDVISANQELTFNITNDLTENEVSGGIAARLTGAPTGVDFTFADGTKFSSDGNFQIIGNKVILTSGGQSTLSSEIGSAGVSGFNTNSDFPSNYVIKATGPNGKVVTQNFNPVIHDVAVNLNGGGEYNAHNLGLINAGDVDHDGHDDFAFINGSNQVEFVDTPGGSTLQTSSGSAYDSLANVGDLNNDGYDDFLAGSTSADPGASPNTGGTAFIHGSASAPLEGGIDFDGDVASAAGDNYGHSVSGAGDFDGDGELDYIVGAPGVDGGGTNKGAAYIHSSEHGVIEILGNNNQNIGSFVAGIGDINGDGLSDVLITGSNLHEAYSFLGGITGDTTIVNNDSTINTGSNFIISGGSAGDFNGDGFDDTVISITADNTTDGDAQTYVVFGGNTIGDVSLSDLENPNIAFKINDANGFKFGHDYVARSIGDTNGDGFDDIEIGSDTTGFHTIHGEIAGDAPYASDNTATDANPTVGSVSASAHGQSLIEATHYYDNDKDNVSMVGNAEDNTFLVRDETFRNIDGGSGDDAIRYGVYDPSTGGGTVSLDFSAITYEEVSGIEAIQYTQDDATIELTIDNIFNLLKTSDNGELKIELDSGLTTGFLNIDADTAAPYNATNMETALNEAGGVAADHNSSNAGFDTYDIGGYTLYIDQTITTAIV